MNLKLINMQIWLCPRLCSPVFIWGWSRQKQTYTFIFKTKKYFQLGYYVLWRVLIFKFEPETKEDFALLQPRIEHLFYRQFSFQHSHLHRNTGLLSSIFLRLTLTAYHMSCGTYKISHGHVNEVKKKKEKKIWSGSIPKSNWLSFLTRSIQMQLQICWLVFERSDKHSNYASNDWCMLKFKVEVYLYYLYSFFVLLLFFKVFFINK